MIYCIVDATLSFYHKIEIGNSSTTTTCVLFSENASKSKALLSFSASVNSDGHIVSSGQIGTYYYYENSLVGLCSLLIPAICSAGCFDIGTVYANLTGEGITQSFKHVFDVQCSRSNLSEDKYVEISPSWIMDAGQKVTFSLNITETYYEVIAVGAPYSEVGSNVYTFSGADRKQIVSSLPPESSIGFDYGWHFKPTSSTYSTSPDVISYLVVWSSNYYGNFSTNSHSDVGTSGSISGSLSTFTVTFTPMGDPTAIEGCDSEWTYSYTIESQIQAQKKTTSSSFQLTQPMNEYHNWYNSSLSFTVVDPSTTIDNTTLATTSGTINAGTYAKWTVSNITIAGYDHSPAIDIWSYSGYQSDVINLGTSPPQYESITEGTGQLVGTGGITVNYAISEFIKYVHNIPIFFLILYFWFINLKL